MMFSTEQFHIDTKYKHNSEDYRRHSENAVCQASKLIEPLKQQALFAPLK